MLVGTAHVVVDDEVAALVAPVVALGDVEAAAGEFAADYVGGAGGGWVTALVGVLGVGVGGGGGVRPVGLVEAWVLGG